MNNGYIKLHRKILDWQWYTDIPTHILFEHLLLTANWQDKKWRNIVVKRGQRVTSLQHLADETGLSIQQVRTALDKLKSSKEITQSATKKYTLVTIENYDLYQLEEDEATQLATINQQTNNKQITTNEESNKERNICSSIGEYEKNIGTLSKVVAEELMSYAEDMNEELINEAIHIASRNNKRSWSYVKAILDRWTRNGYTQLADLKNDKKIIRPNFTDNQLSDLEQLYEN